MAGLEWNKPPGPYLAGAMVCRSVQPKSKPHDLLDIDTVWEVPSFPARIEFHLVMQFWSGSFSGRRELIVRFVDAASGKTAILKKEEAAFSDGARFAKHYPLKLDADAPMMAFLDVVLDGSVAFRFPIGARLAPRTSTSPTLP